MATAIRLPHVSRRALVALTGITTVASATYVYSKQKQQQQKTTFSPFNNKNNNNNKNGVVGGTLASAVALNQADTPEHSKADYQKVYNAIAQRIRDDDEYDDYIGWGPVLVRYAWHSSGTYTAPTPGCPFSGGSFGGTIRHPKEIGDGANNGLQNAEWFMRGIYKEFPWLSWGDLATLGGVVAIQEMGGPKIGWRAGRHDSGAETVMVSKLPDASQNADYVRNLFARMGFEDRETVSLIGAHALGSCHVDAPRYEGQEGPIIKGSGYIGRWTASPNVFTNEFFKLLLEDGKWHWKKWDGPKQYWSDDGLMMLPADMALVEDANYKKIVEMYAKDQDLYFKDFAKDFQKLLELGIDFPKSTETWYFDTLDEQEI
ncbi:CYFA0S01e02806g1_1 [Cyberlindnera fabianii]|uniref:Peroxidase n=1 Tax=Cyberlindnera fabianii TaxID=36022 RepID=A0A061AHJ2_CYBFA|nr:CYFA0S01e02806g1_1 [Cyberlindnera fabianii]